MIDHENYRYASDGYVKVYGNSVEIKEECNPLTREQIREYARNELRYERDKMNEDFERAFRAHVLKYGQDFDKYDFWLTKEKEKPEPPKRERGDISGFSRKSRYRLLKKLNQLNPDSSLRFLSITLTYPKRFPREGEIHKADLDTFLKRCKRKFGEIEYLWKLEFQKRGAPHYHLMVVFEKEYHIQYMRNWIADSWFEVVQRFWSEKDDKHHRAGTQCKRVESLKKAGVYLSKYISKEEDNVPEGQGRFWGCSRNWGEVILSKVKLTGNQLVHFRRLVKRFLKGHYGMQKIITNPFNIVIFGHWSFFVKALSWVKKTY